MLFCRHFLVIIIGIFAPISLYAGELTGFVALENQAFIHAPGFAAQGMNSGTSLVIQPEYYHVTEDGKNTITFTPYARLDYNDDKRNHWDIRQLDIVHADDDWELQVGISKVFWGVTESSHLVDIINQTDSVDSLDGEEKLGQPMIQLGVFKDWGALRLFYLPYFRERTFASIDGRLRGKKPIETDRTTYASKAKRWHPDIAIRYENTIGDWDIGLAHFSGTSREPGLVEATSSDGEDILIPHYDIIDQTSTDIQYTNEGWLWKLEAMTRTGQGRRFAAFTGGVEYTLYSIADSNVDLGILTEYQFDDRSGSAPGTFADNDIFAGLRLTLNDTQDTAILGGTSIDNNTQAMFFFLEAERRIGNSWKIELESRIFSNINSNAPEAGIRYDDYLQLRIAKYF